MRRKLALLTLLLFLVLAAATTAPARANPLAAASGSSAASGVPDVASGVIGAYPEAVGEVAVAVEANGRIHVLWTGQLNPDFSTFAFYSTSTDGGVTWTPYHILNYWMVYEPQIVVDDVHHRVHLMYRSNYDGIVHHTVTNGVVSAPTILDSNGVTSPQMAVDPTTGFVYAVWQQGYLKALSDGLTYSWRQNTWYAYWNGTAWSPRIRRINDADTCYSDVAVAPGGRAMLAWFQRCQQTAGDGTSPGDPNVPRSAYGDADPALFPLRQAVSEEYTIPQKDDTILLTYVPGSDAFYLTTEHLMWPTHSRVYRYIWKNGVWSAPVDVVGNTQYWAVPTYVGAATDTAKVNYIYGYDGTLTLRTETNGTLNTPVTVADYLAARGYTGTPGGYFTDRAGDLHMAVVGAKGGVSGFYYVEP